VLSDRQAGVAQADSVSLSPFWVENFSTPIDPARYYVKGTSGAGVIQSGYFVLTPFTYSQRSRIVYSNTLTLMDEFTATFRAYFGTFGAAGGDGIAFAWCPHYSYKPAPIAAALTDGLVDAMCPGGYILDFDTFEGHFEGTPPVYVDEPDRVYVAYEHQSARLIQRDLGFDLERTGWHTIYVNFANGDIGVTIDITPVIVSGHIPGYVPFWGYFGFAADTGGSQRARNEQRVDDVQVYASTPGPGQPEIVVDDDFSPLSPGWGLTATNTLSQAMWMVRPPGQVRVLPGTYLTTWLMPLATGGYYTPTFWLRPGVAVRGSGPFATALTAQNRNRVVVGNYSDLVATDVFSGFTVQGGNPYDWRTQVGGGIDLWGGTEKIVNSRVINNIGYWGGGVALVQSDATLINLMVAGNQVANNPAFYGSGVYVNSTVLNGSGPRLIYNTIARNLDSKSTGVYVENGATVGMTNTILAGEATGVFAASGTHTTLYATLWGAGTWANAANTGGSGSIQDNLSQPGDPGFVDPNNGDYHIGADSPARNWASTIPGVNYDVDNQLRVTGDDPLPDVGADEYRPFVGNERVFVPLLTH
jgi:hypothetical protein